MKPDYEVLDNIVLAVLAVCVLGGVAFSIAVLAGWRP